MPTILCRYNDDHCYLSLSFWQTMPYEFRGTVGEITYKPLDFTKSASNGLKNRDSVHPVCPQIWGEEMTSFSKPFLANLPHLLSFKACTFLHFNCNNPFHWLYFYSGNGIYVGVGTAEGDISVYISWNLVVSGFCTLLQIFLVSYFLFSFFLHFLCYWLENTPYSNWIFCLISFQPLVTLKGVHNIFVTGLSFLPDSPLVANKLHNEFALLSISADNTCKVTTLKKRSMYNLMVLWYIWRECKANGGGWASKPTETKCDNIAQKRLQKPCISSLKVNKISLKGKIAWSCQNFQNPPLKY